MNENPQEYFSINELAAKVIAIINAGPQEVTALARAAVDARGVIQENMKTLGSTMEAFEAKTKVVLNDLRMSRMAVLTETTQMLTPLREIRQFFIGRDYDKEIERLREFVSLCERLEGLKQRGSLDVIADTMLRLAVTEDATLQHKEER